MENILKPVKRVYQSAMVQRQIARIAIMEVPVSTPEPQTLRYYTIGIKWQHFVTDETTIPKNSRKNLK